MAEFVENFYFDFARDLVGNDEDEEGIEFETLDIENADDESEINEKDEETHIRRSYY